jgi:cellulose synthase/poly-beta-1,6-N-acetylglucosamine synthase-like glycosyltransferase
LLSVVIPARDEEGCIASTAEHLHLELKLQGVPHEIVVVDDGSRDRTWQLLQELRGHIAELARCKIKASTVLAAPSSPASMPPKATL